MSADLRELLSPIVPAPPVMMIQTADPTRYRRMLHLSGEANAAYCQRHGFGYQAFVGIKSGRAPLHAMYNRIFQIIELLAADYCGWVLHVDADAVVVDQGFDLTGYLQGKAHLALIAEEAHPNPPFWGINNGVFLLNLGSPFGSAIAEQWMHRLRADVPARYLADPDAVWDGAPNDQELLYRTLREIPGVGSFVRTESGLLNYATGTFIQQALRAGGDMATREALIGSLAERSMRAHQATRTISTEPLR